ncbi:MAG TPA: hypothetical protein VFL13_08880 [Candidatus Baltobacteraceae bacterium]|nr:hypothetical protein [Candidatus Baltobacteraceae bacterium]
MDMPRVLPAAASLLLAFAASAAGAGAAATVPDGYGIYDRARHVWDAQRYPDFLSYTIAVQVSERGVEKSRHYHVTFDVHNRAIDVNPVSDEELAAPPTPTGMVIHLQPKRQGHVLVDKKVGNPGDAVDYLGVPKLSPTYAFGLDTGASGDENAAQQDPNALVAEIRKEFNDPAPPQTAQNQPGGLKTIAVVSSRTRAYTIENAGTETIDGHDCWHLLLSPNHDPQRLRLRELWVDRQTGQTRQLLSAGNFTGSVAPWLVDFTEIAGAMYISSETAMTPVGVGDHRYEKASVAFETIAPAARPAHATNFFATKEAIMSEPGQDGGNQP